MKTIVTTGAHVVEDVKALFSCPLKEIPGYEGLYAATEDGRIWSYPREVKYRNRFDYRGRQYGVWLVPALTKLGRLQVSLSKNNETKNMLVHRLVAAAYIPNPHDLPQINHIDGNPKNNAVNNLEWCTAKENQQHAKRLGLRGDKKGTNNGRSKITEKDVKEIREVSKKYSLAEIGRLYNLSKTQVHRIVRGESWNSVPEDCVLGICNGTGEYWPALDPDNHKDGVQLCPCRM